MYAGLLILSLAAMGTFGVVAGAPTDIEPFAILVWAILCAATNLLPVPKTQTVALSLSSPVHVAIAYLFPPPIAGAIVSLASFSSWEFTRETPLSHLIFNRAQLGLATLLASGVFHSQGDPAPVWIIALGAATYHVANLIFVSLAERTARGRPLLEIAKRLFMPAPTTTASYFALALMGIAFALVYRRVGAWAVILLMTPLLMARAALQVSQRLEQSERERRMLSDRLIDERERERVRIASDLHDGVLQDLAALRAHADNIATAVELKLPQAGRLVSETKGAVERAVADLRGAIANLRRASLDEDGLVPTLRRFARSFHSETGVDVKVRTAGFVDAQTPLPLALLLYECAQESLNNVAKHASATRVDVEILLEGASLTMTIQDDGGGIGVRSSGSGLGLKLMQDKVELVGGIFTVDTHGLGTTVHISLPLQAER